MIIKIANRYVIKGDSNSWDLYELVVTGEGKGAHKADPKNIGKIREAVIGYFGSLQDALERVGFLELSSNPISLDVASGITAFSEALRAATDLIRDTTRVLSASLRRDPPNLEVEVPARNVVSETKIPEPVSPPTPAKPANLLASLDDPL